MRAVQDVMNEQQDEVERRNGADRREADRREPVGWEKWKTIVAFASLLLAIIGGFWTIAQREGDRAREMIEMRAKLDAISSGVASTHDLILTTTTKQTAQIEALTERTKNLENAMETQTKAYNFQFTTRLAVVEARAGVKQKE